MACFKNAWLSYHQFVCKPPSGDGEEDEVEPDQEMLERVALNVSRYNKRKPAQNGHAENQAGETGPIEETVDITMEAFFSLMDHYEDHPKAVLQQYRHVADRTMDKPYIVDTGLQQKDLIQLLCRFRCNNFAIHDDQLFAIGEGTYPIGALFNHSCRPNAVAMFDGAHLIIKAIEDIEPGDEITIAYVDTVHSRTYRQASLREKYFFDCNCVRCSEDPTFGQIDGLLGEEESDWDRAENVLNPAEGISATILKEVEAWDLLAMSRKYDRKHNAVPDIPLCMSEYTHYLLQLFTPYLWSVNNPGLMHTSPAPSPGRNPSQLAHFDDPLPLSARPPIPEKYDDIISEGVAFVRAGLPKTNLVASRLTTLSASTRLFYDEIAANRWLNATKLGMYILVQYCLVYPPYHPMLGQHALLLAKAGWNYIIQAEFLGEGRRLEKVYERGVRRWIAVAKENIACSFGKNSAQWRDVVELEWIFMREQKLKR
ncbi:SET and MYND domain-containing protein 3 [Apophysomyces sp. BC1034]|nr:SET and MYND domain-containing protein 3 [Apophysomyces sp. BC1015]KAG0180074.1 SET and MYND domain-containing protein 3 [Apophysomyces sp. BC1021]KAG0193019.1 SET and MYND domain-containing protein 3 [Apophysomyces sp. BC1034]